MRKWVEGREPFWFVCSANGTPWVSTCRESRKNSIAAWRGEDPTSWRLWYQRGCRCKLMKVRLSEVKP